MKHLYILIVITNLSAPGMSKYSLVNPPPTTLQEMAVGMKELRYQLAQHPVAYSSYASILAAATIFSWDMHPLACAGLHYFTTVPTLLSATIIIPREAKLRKVSYKAKMLFSLEQGKLDEVAQFASKTCYEETDIISLQEQNTEFLFDTLDAYNNYYSCNVNKQELTKYLQAASIFLKQHANKAKILHILTHDLYMPHAQKWLELNANIT